MTKLLIVESPHKAKKIQKFLGKDYIVLSSYGHITGLDKNISAIDTKNFKMNFKILDDKKSVVKKLLDAKKKCNEVIIATDEDREGEAIGWHLIKTLKLDITKTKRILFNEITKSSIVNALENAGTIRTNFVNAQFARMALDHIVGFRLSPLVWNNISGAKSAGRVQTLIVKLIIDKEDVIKNYVQKEYYKISGLFTDKNLKADIEVEVSNHIQLLKKSIGTKFNIKNNKLQEKERKAPPPFITSTLQQDVCKILNISSKQVMNIAQKLYEDGYITYHRTDSVNLSTEFIKASKVYIKNTYGDEYVKSRQFKSSSNSQEAHEAIRPTNINVNKIDNENNKVYQIIWKRALASQMSNHKYNLITLEISNKNYSEIFISKIEDSIFDGYNILYYKETNKDLIDFYKSLKIGDIINYKEIKAEQKFKKQPERYSESTLIKELEKKGIGRPSTYASMIDKVQERKYILKSNIKGTDKEIINYSIIHDCDKILENKVKIKLNECKNRMISTDLGRKVNEYLAKYFTNIILNYEFTSKLEKDLDLVLQGKEDYKKLLEKFYKDFFIIYNNLIMENNGKKEFDNGRLIGHHPQSNEPIYVRVAKYGPVAQIGKYSKGKKLHYISLKNSNIDTITLDDILEKLKYPKNLGDYNGSKIELAERKYGFCICYNGECYSLYQNEKDDLDSIDREKAIEVIQRKTKKKALKVLMNGRAELLEGPYGRYIRYVKTNGDQINLNIPKDIDINSINDDLIKQILKRNV